MTLQPSWLPSTSGWTQRASNFLTTIAEAYSNFMVRYRQFMIQINVKEELYLYLLVAIFTIQHFNHKEH